MDIAQKHNFLPVVHGDEIWNEFGVHFDDAAAGFGTRHRFCEFRRKETVDRDTQSAGRKQYFQSLPLVPSI